MIIYSPAKGITKEIDQVNDDAFAKKMLGDGIAILPEIGEIVSPIKGVVEMVFPTNHAIGLKSDKGVEVLIHIGIDTVNMEGNGFQAFVRQGEQIDVGDKLITFDIEKIKHSSYDIDTLVILTNTGEYQSLEKTKEQKIDCGDNLLILK